MQIEIPTYENGTYLDLSLVTIAYVNILGSASAFTINYLYFCQRIAQETWIYPISIGYYSLMIW